MSIFHRPLLLGRFLRGISLLALLSACTADNTFSNYPCRFVFNINTHAISPALKSAVSTTGIYCKVSTLIKGGVSYYHFQTNEGLSDDVIYTAEDQRVTIILGTNNGLWFGFSNQDYDVNGQPAFYGYDAECPNCFDPDAIPVKSRPLSVSTTGIASCAVCRREYNMNTGGNIIKGDSGSPLRRFRHSSYSTTGIVSVNN